MLIFGDFNFSKINWDTLVSTNDTESKFIECVNDTYLSQMITDFTRKRIGQNPSTLDLLLTNDESIISSIEHNAPLGKSDHDIILVELDIKKKRL